ncbi:GAF domain-containing protein [Schinkia azotoformans]|uniref:GAF domain-containing protein n=1 Tax=Schinkia azotoformans TaxID=1454 RepID=UPI002DB95EB0|nr:GAF domain-containing protein [Schinkia azotoformans]MEC1720513.1 GAF domain-containing protein [Schinkia azotoformans]MED4414049.1 GAF domain-containing protein [Schinkia azotoformans]
MKNEKLGLKGILNKKLQSTVTELNADFSAIAFYDPINLEFRWRLAVGSLNQRYTSIVVRSGKGIAGRTLKTKREFIITRFPEELQDEAIEFPILIIEELKSAVAVPLLLQNQMIGVLLIGQRSYREFGPNEVSRIKEVAEEMLASYIQEREVARPALEDKKENQKSALSRYFIEEKTKRGDKIKFILLDQRITLLPGEIQQSFISIFQYLFDFASWAVADSKVKVVIERKSDQQFSIEIDTQTNIEIPPDTFSCLADRVRWLKGSIEVACDNEKTVLTMNFFLNLLLSSNPWDRSHH